MPTIQSPPIQVGRPWRQRIQFIGSASPVVPVGATFRAEVRSSPVEPAPLATLTTAAGNFTRVDDNTLDILVRDTDSNGWTTALSAAWTVSATGVRRAPIAFDIVRTDLSPAEPLYLRFTGEAEIPTTRG